VSPCICEGSAHNTSQIIYYTVPKMPILAEETKTCGFCVYILKCKCTVGLGPRPPLQKRAEPLQHVPQILRVYGSVSTEWVLAFHCTAFPLFSI